MKWDVRSLKQQFPNAAVLVKQGRLYSFWVIGNDYRRKYGYHGEYPPSYLERVFALFPEHSRVLHLFSGTVDFEGQVSFDCNERLSPNIVGNAEKVDEYFEPDSFDLVLADPPYTSADAEKYGYKMPDKAKVLRSVRTIVSAGAVLVWLDIRAPRWANRDWKWIGSAMVHCGSNRLVRTAMFFRAA